MAQTPHDPGGWLDWWKAGGIALATSAVTLFGLLFKRRETVEQLVERKLKVLLEQQDREIDTLRNEVQSLRRELDDVRQKWADDAREKDRLQIRVEQLSEQLREKTAALTSAVQVRQEDEGTINRQKAELHGLSMQVQLLLGQVQKAFEQRYYPPARPFAQVSGRGSVLVAKDGTILAADDGMQELFGGPLAGESVLVTIPPQYHAGHLKGFVAAVESGVLPEHPQRVLMARSDGSTVAVEMTLAAEGEGFRAKLRTVE